MKIKKEGEGKGKALIAHLTIIGCLIALFMNKEKQNEFASFYIRQTLGIHLYWLIFTVLVTGFDSWLASMGFYLSYVILWFYSFINAIQYKKQEIPVIGLYFQKWFKQLA